jgi:hypothetical protein
LGGRSPRTATQLSWFGDGVVAAVWKLERGRSGALVIDPVRALRAGERRAVLAKAEALLELIGTRPVRLD